MTHSNALPKCFGKYWRSNNNRSEKNGNYFHVHILNSIVRKRKFGIECRRKKVASLIAQSMTETEIAEQLKVDQSTISRDIKVLEKMSQQFVYDLAKSDFLLLQAMS